MKRIITCLSLFLGVFTARADHITGGEMYYKLQSTSGGQYRYNVTLRLFMDCYSNRNLPNPTIIGVFDRVTGARVMDIPVPRDRQEELSLSNASPCITNPPQVCYQIGYYNFDVTVPASSNGYVLTCQVVYRVNGIANLSAGYSNVGATYTGEIPGTSVVSNGPQNNSARFTGTDLVVICANNSFSYSFAAEDVDGDQLRYSFCNAYQGGTGGGNSSNPPVGPPYESVPYGNGYGASAPMGGNVKIDPATGMITGIAPGEGIYVVTVCVEEIRNGRVIATQRKDLQIRITSCTIAAASIQPEYMVCRDTRTISLVNTSTSPLIISYNWELTNAAGNTVFSSTSVSPSYTFPDTGTYKIKLVINRNQQCSDSAESIARVYPGFYPGFSADGICFSKPTQFIDTSTTVYGQVNSWNWDFGDLSVSTDVSSLQNPTYTYPSMGVKNVRLIATNTKGCRDTITRAVTIVDKPPLSLAFRDTLICIPDNVQLGATGNGAFSWAPGINITGSNTATPTVAPATTTTYVVTLDDNGCINKDSVRVRVVDHVTLQAMGDTVICQGDPIQLYLTSDGLRYAWTPAQQVLTPGAANPQVVTHTTTTYEVTAFIGSCSARDQVLVTTIPYPVANAGPDTVICHDSHAQLSSSTDGSSFTWLPAPGLSDLTVADPVVRPPSTTFYILAASDTKGCPKPGFDTVVVVVLPDINPQAGNDTAVVVGQPLQLNATGGVRYQWIPGSGLSDPSIGNPIAVYLEASSGILYKILVYNEAGCVDSVYKRVKVFQTFPSVFVPNAFTPNSDGRNDVLRPVAAGIAQIDFFHIYNRWGQLVYRSTSGGNGWDGTIAGKLQASGTYVWVVKAVDYTGAPYVQRGTVTLIR